MLAHYPRLIFSWRHRDNRDSEQIDEMIELLDKSISEVLSEKRG